MTMQRDRAGIEQVVERWIGIVLRTGIWSSIALVAAGIVFSWLGGSVPGMDRNLTIHEFFAALFAGTLPQGVSIPAYIGITILAATPILRVATAIIGFIVERDWKFVLVSLLVLAMLTGEVLFALKLV